MTEPSQEKHAVIYCRVASMNGGTKGGALASQEARCRQYATDHGYELIAVFHDIATATSEPRPGLEDLLVFLKGRPQSMHVVVIDSMSVLGRSVDAYVTIRQRLLEAGATLKSPSFDLGTDAESKFVEMLAASIPQFEERLAEHHGQDLAPSRLQRAVSAIRRAFQ
jgi:site-specific DNA recombinase